MANKYRGEVDIEIGGKSYTVAMTIDAFARVAEAVKAVTLADVGQSMLSYMPAQMLPILAAILAGNDIEVDAAALRRVHWQDYRDLMAGLLKVRPAGEDDATADPPTRAS